MARIEKIVKISLVIINTIWLCSFIALIVYATIFWKITKPGVLILNLPLFATIQGFYGIVKDNITALVIYSVAMVIVLVVGIVFIACVIFPIYSWIVVVLAWISSVLSVLLILIIRRNRNS